MTTIDLPSIAPGARTRRHPRHAAPAIAPLAAAPAQPAAVTGEPVATVARPSLLQRLASLLGTLLMQDDAADDPTEDAAVPAHAGISLHAPRPATDRALMSQLPALDRAILENLGMELSSQAGALQFAGLFVDMLPQRIRAVEDAFADRDTDAVVVALLSLTVSASMVGARRLEEAASAALDRVDEPGDAAALIAQLQGLGVEFQAALGGIIR